MPSQPHSIDAPVQLRIGADGMAGRNDSYEVFLPRLSGVYLDEAAFQVQLDEVGAEVPVYTVDVHSYNSAPGSLTIGTSTLLAGKVGEEFALTRGHLHARSDRAELYYCLAGRGVMLMDTLDGQTSAVELTPGLAVHVPGHWVHRSVNVGCEPFVTLFCYNGDAGQDYEVIAAAGGMKTLIVDDHRGGWKAVENPRHTGYGTSAPTARVG
jgi:glucose-6-phosphate isomerase